MNPLSKGTALITGGSSGIGAVYADRFAKRGHDLILVARDLKELDEVAHRISNNTGASVTTLVADLTNQADLAWIEQVLRTDASITVLVNNAGMGMSGNLAGSDPDHLESMIRLNVLAPTLLALGAIPRFIARGSGTLINISSVLALAPELFNGSYSGTKAYVVSFTQALKSEVEGAGVTVQAVLPGATATPFWEKSGRPIQLLPSEIVMTAEDMVDASLAGLDQHEAITIPALPDIADWEKFETARKALGPNLSRQKPAARYGIGG